MGNSNINSFFKIFCFVLVVFIELFKTASAVEFTDDIYFNGFFTLDLSVTDTNLGLLSNSDKLKTYEKHKPSFRNSIIGGQLTYQLYDNLTTVAQAKLHATSDDGVTGKVDWSYLSYDFGNDIKVRAGKFQIPFMQGIELRNIGFSRLWARPLIPSSGAGGYQSFVGAEVLKHISLTNGNWDFQISAGKAEHGLKTIDNKNIQLISARYQQDSFWIRGAILHAESSIYTESGKSLDDSAKVLMASFEAEYSISSLIFNAGYSINKADIAPDDTTYYFSTGYQFNNITPFVYLSRKNQHFVSFARQPSEMNPGSSLQPPPPQSLPPTPDGDFDVYSLATGFRFNFSEQYSLKMQAEHIKERDNAGIKNRGNTDGTAFSLVIEGVF